MHDGERETPRAAGGARTLLFMQMTRGHLPLGRLPPGLRREVARSQRRSRRGVGQPDVVAPRRARCRRVDPNARRGSTCRSRQPRARRGRSRAAARGGRRRSARRRRRVHRQAAETSRAGGCRVRSERCEPRGTGAASDRSVSRDGAARVCGASAAGRPSRSTMDAGMLAVRRPRHLDGCRRDHRPAVAVESG